MQTRNKITTSLLRSIMIIFMMGWMGSVWGQESASPQTIIKKTVYKTDFTDWTKQSDSHVVGEPPITITKKTTDGKDDITFKLNTTSINPGEKEIVKAKNGQPAIVVKGYMMAEKRDGKTISADDKVSKPSEIIITFPEKYITNVKFTESVTGSNRGWGLEYTTDGTTWTNIFETKINSQNIAQSINVNKKISGLRFYNLNSTQNAYLTDLEIEEEVEVSNIKVNYFNTDGSYLGADTYDVNAPLVINKTYQKEIEEAITAKEVFRGWFDGKSDNALKIEDGYILKSDLNLYAKVTPIEEATYGSEYTYDLTKNYFYQEDHELIDITGGVWNDPSHGWYFENGGTIKVKVAKNASIDIPLCNNNTEGMINVYDGNNQLLTRFENKSESGAEDNYTVRYNGTDATTLTFNIPSGTYIHSLHVRNMKLIIVSFDFKGNKLEGDVPSSILCDDKGQATLPRNGLFYRDGWTFEAWTDGTNDYEANKTYTFTEDVTLKPKMTQNTLDITETNAPTTVTWYFDNKKAPEINIQKNKNIIKGYTASGTIVGSNKTEKQDIKMLMDAATNNTAKIDNTDSRINGLMGEGAQVNDGTIFSIPAVYGMTIAIKASNKVDDTNSNTTTDFKNSSKIKWQEGKDKKALGTESITDSKNISFTYTGDSTQVNIIVEKAGTTATWGFLESISVTYPVLPHVEGINVISNADKTNFPQEKAENAGTVNISSTASHKNTGKRFKKGDVVTLTAQPNYGYTLDGYRLQGGDGTLLITKDVEITEDNGTKKTLKGIEYTIDKESGITNIEIVYQRQEMHKVIVKSANVSLGNVDLYPQYENFYQATYDKEKDGKDGKLLQVESWYTEGTSITVSADAVTDYALDNWTEDNSTTSLSQNNSYTFTVGKENKTIVAHFKIGNVGNVIFKISDAHVNGANNDLYESAGSMQPTGFNGVRSFVIPTNYTIFKNIDDKDQATTNNYTLKYWALENDTTQHYELGKQYSFTEENQTLTLIPVFDYNPTTQENRVSSSVIRYDFGRQIHEYADPTTNETRKVCAQTVNIDKNQNVFWTAHVWVNILENSERKDHWRDVALWCNTGKKGYIRNDEFNDWCAIGPGTTLWFPSGNGTKISILTYSPISTTTIDGVVPTLDQARTDSVRKVSGNSHMYVYSYTTAHSSDRLPIVIGDDYTYYQWIELNMLAANWVDYHGEIDDDSHGVIDETTTNIEGHAINELENGDYSFHKGERVKLTFHRKKGYELSQIVGLKKVDADGNPLPLLKMNTDGTVDMINYDFKTYTTCKKNEDGSWGVESGDNKTMWVLKATEEKDKYNAEDSIRTKYELTFEITAHRSVQIQFKEKPTYYITYNPGDFASGTSPEAQWVEENDQFEIPRNQTLYYEGHTLDHWVDEQNIYANSMEYTIGQRYPAPNKNLRMFPVFEPNTFNILDVDGTAVWNFTKNDDAPTISYQTTAGILVTQLENANKEKIDLKIDLDGTKGKFDNTNVDRPERIQINQNSVISFPSTSGCTAQFEAVENGKSIKIAGQSVTLGDNNIATATCSGDSVYQKVEFTNGVYGKSFSVTYKKQSTTQPELSSLTCNEVTYNAEAIKQQMKEKKCITFTGIDPWKNNEKMPDVTGTATQEGKVEATKATILTKECAVTVKNKAGVTIATYPVKFEFATPTDAPTLDSIIVNNVTYKDNNRYEINDAPRNGVIKLNFNRTIKATTVNINGITHTTKVGKEQELKYWDKQPGSTIKMTFQGSSFTDIYGKECLQDLTLTLHIANDDNRYHHHKFDFIVGQDGDINEAINAANGEATGKKYNNDKTDGHRYFIFVPDGEHQLKGNNTITFPANGVPMDENGIARPEMNGQNNGMTDVKKPNISLIGQSKEGTTIWNHPVVEGISYTATLNLINTAKDFYAQDFSLENRFDYWASMTGQGSGGAGRAAAFADRGNRTTLKNVALWSWQDTYYSANGADGYRGYFEDCDLAGVVDWICGSGDIWFEKCNLIIRDRTGNNMVAPHTELGQEWGYIFNNCTIKPETDKPTRFKGKDWTLGRPWGSSPACTFLNTKMITEPRNYGWGRMGTNMVLRFHEYRSLDANGTPIPLETRSLAACAPAPGSDDCVLTDTTGYNVRNVLGGTDAYEPNMLCQQIDAKSGLAAVVDDGAEQSLDTENHIVWNDNLVINDDMLQWDAIPQALCYFIFKRDENGKWIYQENTTESSINLNSYGSGFYYVRAANQRGGLGSPTAPIQYVLSDPYTLEIKAVGDKEGYGYTTICLPFNAKVPEGVTVYAATAHNQTSENDKVSDYYMTLTPVKVINSEKGYVVYGPVGTYSFRPTTSTSSAPTILTGNPTNTAISAVNNNCYVLAYKTWGLGFYKYNGATLAAYRAWLPETMVTSGVAESLSSGRKAIRLVFADGTTPIYTPTYTVETEDDKLYNLNGQQVESSARGGIFISKKKGKIIKR